MLKKRILLSAYAFYPEFGGLEQQIYLLGQEFLKLGHSVTVLTEKPTSQEKKLEVIDGITVHRLPFTRSRTVWAYLKLSVSLIWYVFRHKKSFDVAYLRSALTLYPLLFGLLKACKVINYPIAVTADTGGDTDEIIIVKRWPLYRLMISLFNHLDSFNSICQANYIHYLDLGFSTNKMTRIANGIDIRPFSKSTYPSRVKNFMFIGRFIAEKGLKELILSMKIINRVFPGTKLYLAGDGPYKTEVLNLIKKHNLERTVIYKGRVSGKQKEDFYSFAECLVLPSYSEGSPVSVLEAAARKKAMVTTDVSDLKSLFGSQIIFCKKRSTISLTKALVTALQTDFGGKLNYSKFIDSVDITNIAKKYLALFE